MSEVLKTARHGDVLVLTMHRPERHHALNRELAVALVSALKTAEADGTRAVVLSGSGEKAFCAGQDMLEASGLENGSTETQTSSAYLAIDAFTASPLPLIAAINGYCYGGGAALAIACDIRLAVPAASFRLPGAAYGLVVGAAAVPRLIGAARAKELIFTARKFFADEALQWGLLNSLHEPPDLLPAAMTLAEEIAANSPIAVRESKRVIDAATMVDDAFAREDVINQALRGSDEQRERFLAATRKVTGR